MSHWGEFTDNRTGDSSGTSLSDRRKGQVLMEIPAETRFSSQCSEMVVQATKTLVDSQLECSSDSNSRSSDINLLTTFAKHQDTMKSSIISWIATTDAFFRSQQKDEVDLTVEEKECIASSTLEKSPSLFLSRYGKYLKPKHLFYFEQFRGDYEVDFYLKELLRSGSKAIVKNRRYQAMQSMIDKGDYFSMQEMKGRNPHLFEHLVGQYMTKQERSELENENQLCSLSSLLMAHMDRDEVSSARRKIQEAEYDMWNNEEEEEEEEEEDNDEDVMKIDSEEKELLREEFVSTMYASFLEGKDEDFDYRAVDENAHFDDLTLRERDAEDHYFDEDE